MKGNWGAGVRSLIPCPDDPTKGSGAPPSAQKGDGSPVDKKIAIEILAIKDGPKPVTPLPAAAFVSVETASAAHSLLELDQLRVLSQAPQTRW